jgi:hypothetical protein
LSISIKTVASSAAAAGARRQAGSKEIVPRRKLDLVMVHQTTIRPVVIIHGFSNGQVRYSGLRLCHPDPSLGTGRKV